MSTARMNEITERLAELERIKEGAGVEECELYRERYMLRQEANKKTGSRNTLMLQTLCDMSAGGEQFGIKNKHGDGTEFTRVGDFAITTKGMLMCDHGTSSMCKKTRELKNLQTADWSAHLWWNNRQTGEWVFFKEWYNTSHEKIW